MTKKERETAQDELRRLQEQLGECEDGGLRKVIEARIVELKEKLSV
jgi:hypothetical protein